MKKLALLIAANCLFMAVSAQTTLTIATGTQTPGTSDCTPSRTFVEASNGFRVTYRFDKANINPDVFYPNTFELSYSNFGMTHETTKPALPVRVEDYFLTEGKTLQVSVVSSEYTDLNMQLAPAKPMLLGENDNLSLSDVPQINSYSGFYPSEIVKIDGSEFYRNAELAYVNIYPVQYDMQNAKIRVYSEITFDVKIIPSPNRMTGWGDDHEDNGYLMFDMSMPDFDGNEGGGGNTSYIYTTKPTPNKYIKYDYLIVSAPQFESAVEKFCKWKRQLGYNMFVEYRNDWTSSSIKEYIYDFASTHPDFSHLLLFGSFSAVPSNLYTDYPPIKNKPYGSYYSDLQYACLNGSADYYPDVIYGRIPVSTLSEANTFVDKIVKFESTPPKHENFYNTVTFTSPFITENDTTTTRIADNTREISAKYTETCETIRKRMESKSFNTKYIYQSNTTNNPQFWCSGNPIDEFLRKPNYLWDRDYNDINSAINDGTMSILYRGHGNISGWTGASEWIHHKLYLGALSNDSLQPFVFSIACSTGRPGAVDSFAEAFLKKYGGGCSGIIAATDVSLTLHNNYFADGMFEAIWPKDNHNSLTYETGKIMQIGHTLANHYFDMPEIYRRYQKKIYHCYGDPSMKMYTKQPMDVPEVTVERDINYIKVKVKDRRYMYISIYDPKTDEIVLYYGNEYQKQYKQEALGQPSVDHTSHLIVTVYNDNYRPKVFKNRIVNLDPVDPIIPDLPVLGTLNSCEPTADGQVKINYSTATESSSVRVMISDIYGNQQIAYDCNADSEANIDINRLNSGVYIVSLYVDGTYVDSKRIMK